jgi:hypothetical protein
MLAARGHVGAYPRTPSGPTALIGLSFLGTTLATAPITACMLSDS